MLRKNKLWILTGIAVTLFLGYGVIKIIPALALFDSIPSPHSVEIDTVFANNLIRDLEDYGKILQLDDGQRSRKYINSKQIRMQPEIDSSKYIVVTDTNLVTGEVYTIGGYPKYYKEVLTELNISELYYEDFRNRLEKSKLRTYHKIDSISLFVVDGFLGNSWGYFYNHCHEEPSTYFQLGNYSIHTVEKIGPRWYRFAGY